MASRKGLRLSSAGSANEPKSEASLQDAKQLAEMLSRILENITKSLSKNDSLLEAIESSEVRATQTGSNEVSYCGSCVGNAATLL